MTPEEIQRTDLRHACYHEHGHAQVAWHHGIPATVEIESTGTPNPLEERAWVGRCGFHADTGKHTRMIALAGELAVLKTVG